MIKLAKNNLENKVRSFCVVAIFLKLLKYFSIIFQPCLIFRDLFPILCRDGNKVLGHRSLVGAERARHHSSSHLLSLYHPRCHAKYHQSQPGPGAAISHIGVIQSRSRTLSNPFIAIFQGEPGILKSFTYVSNGFFQVLTTRLWPTFFPKSYTQEASKREFSRLVQ